ncbi:hypothetical protein H6P81_016981 [Aristolochia fimbriata]|uniref:RCK N-terminal domain-containing protein n=1 Tax=Aristolochia fimbriata TaxID=158543 RepID=A0AAV7DX33_ARIFI|nr:hypothetical protein H6P81_016981 [Aristolochia fimbriata]
MDIRCNFPQMNAFSPGTCSSPRASTFLCLSSKFRHGQISYFLGHSRVKHNASLSKKKGKVLSVTNGNTLCKYYGGDANRYVFFSPSKRSLAANLTWARCQSNDSLAYVDGNGRNFESLEGSEEESKTNTPEGSELTNSEKEESEAPSLEDLRELYQTANRELEVARLNSTMFEEKAQKISELAIALKDEAERAWDDVTSAVSAIQLIISEEDTAKEAVQKATMALSMAEARLQLAAKALESAKDLQSARALEPPKASESTDELRSSPEASLQDETVGEAVSEEPNVLQEERALLFAQDAFRECTSNLANCEADLRKLQCRKLELQIEVDRLSDFAEKAQLNALKAEEDVANIMLLAEQAVAFEIEATQRANDAEIALQRAEKSLPSAESTVSSEESSVEEEKIGQDVSSDVYEERDEVIMVGDTSLVDEPSAVPASEVKMPTSEESNLPEELQDQENGKLVVESYKETEIEAEKSKLTSPVKKQDVQKEFVKESSSVISPKALLKKSSRFFSASFFSFDADEEEFTPASIFHGLVAKVKKQAPKLVVGVLLLGMSAAFLNRFERRSQFLQQSDIITTGIEEVTSTAKPLVREIRSIPKRLKKLTEMLPHQEVNEEEASLLDMLWLLLASVVFVPIFQKIPGGSPVLGYLAAGILIGPYGLSIIRHVHGTKAIAEFGVVFLLFNIGLELSVERLSSMKKYVFGLGTTQVLSTAVVVGLVAHYVSGLAGPAAIVIGNGLALSSTAVVLQVLQERGESTSRHGRASFSVLLFQDLAVVVLLILIPLISPNSSKGGVGFQAIAEALGLAAVKAIVAITAIIAGGRLLLRPIYRQIAENQNAEIFSANTLLVILGTSLLTARAGLSMALGAFLAGLLLAETEFSLQVESDIAPYRGLLLGLFFMTVGMSIDPKLLISNFPVVMGILSMLIAGKTLLVALIGKIFGVSSIAAIRVGLLLAPGGEFAFVAFGEAVNQGIMSTQLSSLLFLVVGISMALTPWLAAGGQLIASRFEQHDVRSLLPVESETDDLQDHIIICGFGRVGQIIAQLLSERLIPFVALDVRSDRVAVGRALDLPVYFGDAGSREVLHKVGAERACAAAITLDTPGANYRTVWALSKYFPNVKTFVRAHDVDHGINLEKAGATAVVPETLEPSLQLAAAVLAQAKLPTSEIATAINEFRSRHLSELSELCEATGSSLGYGFSRIMSKPNKPQQVSDPDDSQVVEGTLAI